MDKYSFLHGIARGLVVGKLSFNRELVRGAHFCGHSLRSQTKMARENLAKMKCADCKTTNYFSTRNKKKLKDKLEMKKHCPKCKKHTNHKETK